MLMEKTAREMYAKNREKIIQHVRNNRGHFIVNFYKNGEVKIINADSETQDDKVEFSFKLKHHPSMMHQLLDAEFNKALQNYLPSSRM
jgi:macrodomain Ter protein organizer (MatP/YcbG family)